MKLKSFAILLLVLFISSCESSTEPNNNSDTYTISGTIDNVKGSTLSDETKVYVLWSVSTTSPDYTYVWGKGVFDKDKMTFKVELSNDPPKEALNNNNFGVGQVFLLNDKDLQEGKLPTQYDRTKFVGATGWYGIIYKKNNNSESQIDWMKLFEKGYNIGVGVEGSGTFDSFKPIEQNEKMKLIINNLTNVKFVNWT